MAREQAGGVASPRTKILLVLSLLAAAGLAHAQELLRQSIADRRPMAKGLSYEVSREQLRGTTLVIEAISLSPREFGGSLELLRAEEDRELGKFLSDANGYAAMGLAGRDLRFVVQDGRLENWPISGPALVVEPEGTASLLDLAPPSPPALMLDADTSAPLVIGRDEATTMTARLIMGPVDSLEVARWVSPTDDAYLAKPRRGAQGLIDLAFASVPGARQDIAVEPLAAMQSDVRKNEALLVVPRALMRGSDSRRDSFTIALELPPELGMARVALRTGSWIMRGGESTLGAEPDTTERIARSAIAVNSDTGELMLLCASKDNRGESGANRSELMQRAKERGATEAVELEPAPAALLVAADGVSGDLSRSIRQTPAVLAVVRRPWRGSLSAGFDRIGIADHGVSLAEIPAHPYGALNDLRVAPGAALDGFWAAKFSREPNAANDLVLVLGRRATIRAIDLVHAERAGFSAHMDLKRARIYLSEGPQTPWQLVAEIDNTAPVPRQRISLATPIVASQAKIEILEPSFLPGGDTVRLAEIVFWGS